MRNILAISLLIAGVAGLGIAALGMVSAAEPALTYRAFMPGVANGDLVVPTPTAQPKATPTPEPKPYAGAVKSLYLESARIFTNAAVEERSTEIVAGKEVLQTPAIPTDIAWYPAFGHPGFRASNSLFAGHIDYVGIGKVVFGYLTSAKPGDALYVTMDNGLQYAYTVRSDDIIHLTDLNMDEVVYPPLDSYTDRVTLISCGGTFVPFPGGGGEYDSRVILVAERYIP